MCLAELDLEEGTISEEDYQRVNGDESIYFQDNFKDPFE